jgi:hypothetical protein
VIGLALAAQLAIVAHAPDSVNACDVVEVTVAVSAPGTATPRIALPAFAPFEVLRSTATPHVQLDPRNGGSILAEYRYVLATDQVGTFTIPPFEARSGTASARSLPLRVTVRGPRAGPGTPTVVARARIDTSLDINFRALTEPETVFVGQQANYEVAVFLNETVRDRLRRNPTFYPPDMQAMLAYDLPPVTADLPRRRVGTRCFDALVYQRALFPLVPGRFVIPPAQLAYSLALSASFFSREESHDLVTDSTIIVAIEPPLLGRPREYTGAVGDLAIGAHFDSDRGRVGDPLLLTVRVSGTGNVKLFPPPHLEIPWASVVRANERVRVDTTARRIRGAKEFDWVLTPRIAGELDLAPIRYGYFNPDTRRYAVAVSGAARVAVTPGTLATLDTSRSEAPLPLRTAYRGPVAPPPQQGIYFWLLIAAAPLPALVGRMRRTAREPKRESATAHLRALPRAGGLARDPCHVRRVYAHALADRLGLSAESFTRPGALTRALRRAGVSAAVATDAERFLRLLDEAAYSPSAILPDNAALQARALFEAADREALPRAELRGLRTFTILIAVAIPIGTAVLHALATNNATEEYSRGVAAYQLRQFTIARSAFRASAQDEPWAPDAWANLGTAAWAEADTAEAILGWQRAVRLEPTATDVRDRLDLLQATTVGALGYVPRVPVPVILWSAVAAWWLAWLIGGLRASRGNVAGPRSRRRSSRIAYATGSIAVLMLLAGFDVDQRLAARRLGIVRTTARLSTDPALGGEPTGTAIVGEVAQVVRRQGAWAYVALDGGRAGWIESSNLMSLERGTAN